MRYCEAPPQTLQIEAHPYLNQNRLVALAKHYGLAVTAFSPLGACSYLELDMATSEETLLENKVIQAIAVEHNMTPAQVALRWRVSEEPTLSLKVLIRSECRRISRAFPSPSRTTTWPQSMR